ncbi:flagellar motor protein [Ventosimonas gracilis]|uniref:Flagellar motor protein n=1 Tax=Ventosimonas gracilis TaxID=1680762 RepID=A0A139SHB0_9GAMM|nr:flagellar motor protein [Ventosimonas gracilis]KXU33958.1 flagellar motor protein [Ventosimonas gracilis]
MNLFSLLGIALALIAILGGNYLEGGHIGALLNGPAALIVLGGTLGASLVQTPFSVFKRALGMARWLLMPPRIDLEQGIQKVVDWSQTARSQGLLGLETLAEAEADDYARKGLQLLSDGALSEKIRATLELDLIAQESRDLQAAKLFEAMGGYAPTIGIIGAVLGLIHVMSNLEDASSLGQGIAVAFVATIYGVGFANLLLLPLAGRLKAAVSQQAQYREMLLEGLLSIAEGENPRSIELKLQGFMH